MTFFFGTFFFQKKSFTQIVPALLVLVCKPSWGPPRSRCCTSKRVFLCKRRGTAEKLLEQFIDWNRRGADVKVCLIVERIERFRTSPFWCRCRCRAARLRARCCATLPISQNKIVCLLSALKLCFRLVKIFWVFVGVPFASKRLPCALEIGVCCCSRHA